MKGRVARACHCLCEACLTIVAANKADMVFCGQIGGKPVRILLNKGATDSFMTSALTEMISATVKWYRASLINTGGVMQRYWAKWKLECTFKVTKALWRSCGVIRIAGL